MNHFPLHIGDYGEAISHLSFIEDAAYSRCLRKYYSTEKPLPHDIKAIQRLVGARTKSEKKSVEVVVTEFFYLSDDGWHNARCDRELEIYRQKSEKAKIGARASVSSRKSLIQIKEDKEKSERTFNRRSTDVQRSFNDDPPTSLAFRSTNQEPITNSQEGSTTEVVLEKPREDPESSISRSIQLAIFLRKNGADLTSASPFLIEWVSRNVTDDQALEALSIAKKERIKSNSSQAINAGLINSILLGKVLSKPAKKSRHSGIDQINFSEGVNEDGTF